jgi:hypothetical protein
MAAWLWLTAPRISIPIDAMRPSLTGLSVQINWQITDGVAPRSRRAKFPDICI